MSEPVIGILTTSDDIHGLAIQKKIEQRQGARCHLIPANELAVAAVLTWSSEGAHGAATLPTATGETVDVGALDALWYRRVCATQTLPNQADPHYAQHVFGAVDATLRGILLNEFRGRWVSHPVATELAENKLTQLRAARRAGLRIPATLVSQSPQRIRRFCEGYPGAIVKPVRTRGGDECAATVVVGADLLQQDDVLALSPAIYQECIAGERHLRISVFGEHCAAALVEAEALDWRGDLTVPFSPHALDSALERRLVATLRELGLVMGIFDLKLDRAGEPVFLEVNPQGQFLFVEGLCGLPLGDALATFLVEQATSAHAGRVIAAASASRY
jgi:glutathione synthase/RimK-type ligase-like ATP-grasp enzyme